MSTRYATKVEVFVCDEHGIRLEANGLCIVDNTWHHPDVMDIRRYLVSKK